MPHRPDTRPEMIGSTLPYDDPEFKGRCGPTTDSEITKSDFSQPTTAPEGAPNIVLIMTDDVGFGAASTFGGPCDTPTMTRLAEGGIKYNRFHTTSLCSPTRAALLTGRNPHNASTGVIMERALGFPGYNSIMPKSCGTIGETLRMNGYSTGWFGKNHNVPDWQTSASGPFDLWPTGLGFEKFYGFIGGDTNQWNPNVYDGTVRVEPDRDNPDYHFDADIADQAVDWVKELNALDPTKPFFLYYVPGATHAPHHVPKEWIEKYSKDKKFRDGWDAQREETFNKQKDMGIIPEDAVLTPRPDNLEAWDDQNPMRKEVYTRMMQIYAGFLSFTDHNIGRVVDAIEATGRGDNTLYIYIQGDNGGSAEGTVQGSTNELAHLGNKLPEPFEYIWRNQLELGGPMHYNHFPVAWAWAMNSPMQWTKRFASHFGGTRNGLVMKWPKKIQKSDKIRNQFHHVIDISATILEASGVQWPVKYLNGIEQKPIDGIPMQYTWDEENLAKEGRETQVFEMWGNRGIYHNGMLACTTPITFPWVIEDINSTEQVKLEDFEWELYDLNNDFTQGNNLVKDPDYETKYAATMKHLKEMWWVEAEKYNILPLNFSEDANVRAIMERPSMTLGRKKFIYESGVHGIPEGAAPQLRNQSYTVTAFVSVLDPAREEKTNGVIITQGGRFGGWGLVMLDNKPTWTYKCSQMKSQQARIDWDEELGLGMHKIQVHYRYDGGDELGRGGEWTMTVDDDEANGKSASLPFSVGGRFTVTETLDVGRDSGTPILEDFADKMPFAYNGEIGRVIIDLDDSNMSEEGKARAWEAEKAFMHATD